MCLINCFSCTTNFAQPTRNLLIYFQWTVQKWISIEMTGWIVRHLKIVSFPITKWSEMYGSCCVDFQKTNFKWQTIIEYETEPERIYHNQHLKWSKWIRNNIFTINKWKPIFGSITSIVYLLHIYFGQFSDERFRNFIFVVFISII